MPQSPLRRTVTRAGIRLSLVALQVIRIVKRILEGTMRVSARTLRFFFFLFGGRVVFFTLTRVMSWVHAWFERNPLQRRSGVTLLFVFAFAALLYRVTMSDTNASFALERGSNKTIDAYAEFSGIGGPDPATIAALEAQPLLPGSEPVAIGASITDGTALAAPGISITQLENRLREQEEEYTVEPGDTVSTIAAKFGISTNTILWENKLGARSLIRPGDTLTILPVSGLRHTVKRGETVASIARLYTVEANEILDFNQIGDAGTVAVGQKLTIPEATPPPAPRAVATRPALPSKPTAPPPGITPSGSGMIVPVAYRRISQKYHRYHSGYDLAVAQGTPVWASDDGVVVNAGWGTGYGLYVLIDHGNGVVTRYAHNSKNFVQKGDHVAKGQTIALVGSTGRSTGPHVHFEVIVNGRFVNPTTYVKF